jgi:hypothetical protein
VVLMKYEFEKLVVEASVVVVVPQPDLSAKMIAEGWARLGWVHAQHGYAFGVLDIGIGQRAAYRQRGQHRNHCNLEHVTSPVNHHSVV